MIFDNFIFDWLQQNLAACLQCAITSTLFRR